MASAGTPEYRDIQKLDDRLRPWKLKRKSVPFDGNCFFHAVQRQLQVRHSKKVINFNILRRNCVNFLRGTESIGVKHGESWKEFLHDETAEAYLTRMSQDGEWGDHLMIQATASVLKCTIIIITTAGELKDSVLRVYPKDSEASDDFITIGHVAECHYFSAEDEGSFALKPNGKDIQSVEEGQILGAGKPIGTAIRFDPPKSALATKSGSRKRKKTGASLHAKFQDDMDKGETFGKHKDSFEILGDRTANGDDSEDSEPPYEDISHRQRDKGELDKMMRADGSHARNVDGELRMLLEEPPKKEIPAWDGFEVIPPEDTGNDDGAALHFFTKLAKFLTVIIFGGAVFFGSIASKGSLLVLTNAYSQDYDTNTGCPSINSNHYYLRYMTMLTLMVCLCFPEILSFMYCLYRIIMKAENKMDWGICFKGMIPEILHAVGLTFFVLKVVPNIDSTLAVLSFSLVGAIPSVIHLHAKYQAIDRNKDRLQTAKAKFNRSRDFAFSIISLILQPGGIALLCWQISVQNPKAEWTVYFCTALSLVLISCRYWENFVTCDFAFTENMRIRLHETQKELDRIRFKTGIIYSLVRMAFIVGMCFLIYFVVDGYEAEVDGRKTPFREYRPGTNCKRIVTSFWYATMTHCLCGLGAFWFGRTACQTLAQVQAYSFPLILVSPIMSLLTSLYAMQGAKYGISLTEFFGFTSIHVRVAEYATWRSTLNPESWQIAVIVVVGLIVGWGTTIMLAFYMWQPTQERLARTEVLFVKPIYAGILINEDLMMNRRQYLSSFFERKKREDETQKEKKRRETMSARGSKRMSRRLTINMNRNFTPQVFLCATMWHETEQEMTQLLTSIMRLDRDQGMRRPNARNDRDYYNFQVHVMFDDAMEPTAEGSKPNKWVQTLIRVLPFAANKVELGTGDRISPPVIYPTPYGGRLEFVLPCGNLFLVHLKDKSKIRHRKRWSQCMYMYYILGYLQQTKKAYKQENVFILALDGDVDFQPKSMLLLLDRMKRNPDVGAACGRIHPIGSGPVVWFQKFEYAVGHWLQKTAEHVLGCVMCSPGCFSLFRGEALMDVNVVKMYTTPPTEALHYIQWDQGEDRWLCTLLLKQGWRIEFSAASDSYTFAPEEFKEFYNQRRRWGPSTMANVFDILMNAGLTVRNNQYISWGYISYQMGLMASSILGPATVVLVVQGGFQYVFTMSAIGSLMVALIPVVIFVILCYTTKPDFQIAVAGILTIMYALVMMAVLVGIVGQMTETLLNPNSIFMLAMIFIYAFTGIIHPTEMLCLLHGILYYLCVPSAFILLMVYSLCNMNNVSWGTREIRKPEAEAQQAQEKALKELAAKNQGQDKNKKSLQLGPSSVHDQAEVTQGYYSCGLGTLCQCALCIQPPPPPPPQQYHKVPTDDPSQRRRSTMYRPVVGDDKRDMIRKYSIAKSRFMGEQDGDASAFQKSLNHRMSVYQLKRMIELEGGIDDVAQLRKSMMRRRTTMKKMSESREKAAQLATELEQEGTQQAKRKLTSPTGIEDDDEEQDDAEESDDEEIGEERTAEEEQEGLYWIIEGPMEDGIVEYLDDNEHDFWREMIKKYLLPLNEDKKEQARIKADLEALKNKMTGAYFLINALWIVLTFSLTLAIQDINITFYDKNGNEIVLQPLAFMFLIFFLVILVIQFTTMLIHRWSTFIHLMSTTSFGWSDDRSMKRKNKQTPAEDNVREVKKNRYQKKKDKKRDKKRPNSPGFDELETGSTHDNPAYESNNFSFHNSNGTSSRPGHVRNTSDASDLDEPHVVQIGRGSSLRWQDEASGLAATLAEVRASQVEEPDYDEIIPRKPTEDSLDNDDIWGTFTPPMTSQPKSSFGPAEQSLYDDVMNGNSGSGDDGTAQTMF